MAVRAVIFDMGGVLLRTEDQSGRREWEQRLGLRQGGLSDAVFGSDVSYRASIGELKDADVWKNVGEHFKLSEADAGQLARDFFRGDRLDTELASFLASLRPKYKTAILSNAWPAARKTISETLGLGNAVDWIIISAEVGCAKPQERIYRIALDKLGVQPEEAIFLDDMPENVQAARAIGMIGLQFVSTKQAIRDIEGVLSR
ncbi:MAG: HAD family phosphatase [Chloroflexi bacterium]|nr:HAD family phosphatase [Chloroflexota bacterium]